MMRSRLTMWGMGVTALCVVVISLKWYGGKAEMRDASGHASRVRERALPAMTPAKAEDMLSSSRAKFPAVRERADYCGDIIADLCRAGYTQEAWEMIESGKGVTRTAQLARFFREAKWSDEKLVEIIAEHPGEMTDHLSDFFSRFAPEKLGEIGASGLLEILRQGGVGSDEVMGALMSSLMDMADVGSHSEGVAALHAGRKLHRMNLLDAECFYTVVKKMSRGDSFARWSALQEVTAGTELSPADVEYQNEMVRNMVTHHAARTLEVLTKAGDSPQSLASLNHAVRYWIRMESNAATEWYRDNRTWLTQPQRDAVSEAHFSQAIASRELDTARKWIDEISNKETRSELRWMLDE